MDIRHFFNRPAPKKATKISEKDPYYQYDILDCPDMKRLTIQVAMDKEYEQITKDLKKGKITPQESLIRRKAIAEKQKAYLESL